MASIKSRQAREIVLTLSEEEAELLIALTRSTLGPERGEVNEPKHITALRKHLFELLIREV